MGKGKRGVIFGPEGELVFGGVLGNRGCQSCFKPEASRGLWSSPRRLGATKGWVAGVGTVRVLLNFHCLSMGGRGRVENGRKG